MSDSSSTDPVPQLIADARLAFELAVDTLLAAFQASWDSITREDWRTLRRALLQQFDACIPLRSTADPKLRQLVSEAFELLNDDDSRLSIREWTSEARKILQAEEEPIN